MITIDNVQKSEILIEALPYIQKFAGKTIVIKYGGSTINTDNRAEIDPVIWDIVWLKQVGLNPVVVHGGGKAITQLLNALGYQAQFIDGLRVTDHKTMDVVEMVLGGKINNQLVSALNKVGGRAVGLTGVDGSTLQVKKKQHKNGDLGLVGEISQINTALLQTLIHNQFIPVVAPIGVDQQGVHYNVNADSAAGAIAGALNAEKLILLTDVDGIMQEGKVISEITEQQINQLIDTGVIYGGMLPKVAACLTALHSGAKQVHILNGNEPHSLLLEIFTKQGIGTLVNH